MAHELLRDQIPAAMQRMQLHVLGVVLLFVVATAYSWWRWRRREREEAENR